MGAVITMQHQKLMALFPRMEPRTSTSSVVWKIFLEEQKNKKRMLLFLAQSGIRCNEILLHVMVKILCLKIALEVFFSVNSPVASGTPSSSSGLLFTLFNI
jgi:hypothetical protein